MMDNTEAIKRIQDHMRVHRIGEYPHIKIAEALEMAISALATDNDDGCKWIPVTERLPKPYENVIGWTKYRERGVVSHNGKWFVWEDDEGDYAHVTHWMPLPDAPKDGDSE